MVIRIAVDAPVHRADSYLSGKLGVARNQVQRLIADRHVLLNGKPFKPSAVLRAGDLLTAAMPEPAPSEGLKPLALELDIRHEDADIIVINKPRGIVVHPSHGHRDDTIVNALVHHCRDLGAIGGTVRPGVVHRLDKDTAGVMVFAKSERAYYGLQRQFRQREVVKRYLALVIGAPPKPEDVLVTKVGRSAKDRKKFAVTREGREAVTQYRVLQSTAGVSLVEAVIGTGRTHQIRIHMEHIGAPIVGDPCYNRRNYRDWVKDRELLTLVTAIRGQALFAEYLEFTHPADGRRIGFHGTMPGDMAAVCAWMEDHGTRR